MNLLKPYYIAFSIIVALKPILFPSGFWKLLWGVTTLLYWQFIGWHTGLSTENNNLIGEPLLFYDSFVIHVYHCRKITTYLNIFDIFKYCRRLCLKVDFLVYPIKVLFIKSIYKSFAFRYFPVLSIKNLKSICAFSKFVVLTPW